MPLKFIGPESGSSVDAIEAINYAKNMGADVASNSWGYTEFDPLLEEAILNFNKPFVAAASNDALNNDLTPMYPAAYECANIISVAAVDSRGTLAFFSNFGAVTVDVGAPGVNIISCAPENNMPTKTAHPWLRPMFPALRL